MTLFGADDKDELRRRLTIREVARQLIDSYGAKGPHIMADGTAICPFPDGHGPGGDTHPSFYLWDGDDGIERWWCQPCGFGGDLFDLIRHTLRVTFPEAIEVADRMLASLPPDYVAPTPATAKTYIPQMDDWINRVNVARNRADEPDKRGLLAARLGFVSASDVSALALEWDTFLRATYGWGLDPDTGAILMPHWNERGELTGCKVRTSTHKESLPGSKYAALYGAWLGRRHQDVVLTEGESDAVFTAWLAAQERIPIDVFGLPSGANRPVLQEQLDFLGRSGVIYLALDPDRAGVAATRAWITALAAHGHTDIRVCALPQGLDLRAAKPELKRLLAQAKRPLAPPDGIQESPGGYIRLAQDGGMREATSWTIEPLARLIGGEDPGYDVLIHTRKTSVGAVLRLSDLASTQALNRWANKHELVFVGSDADRKVIALWIESLGSVAPEVFQTEQVGVHEAPEEYHFAGPSIVYPEDYIGKLPWRYAPTGKSASNVKGRVRLPRGADAQPFEWAWLDAFLRLSATEVTHPMLAWLVAATRRHEVRDFPLLFIGGSSGVGKSTLARLAIRLSGSDIEVDLGSVTPFILVRTLAASTTIPIFVDEWTRLSRPDTREAFQGMIPLLYTGGQAERGQADLTSVSYHTTAPTIVAGEDTFELDRERDRTITIFPSRATQNREALASIETQPLEGFAAMLHSYLLRRPELVPLDYAPAPTRPVYNQQVLLAGWLMLTEFLHEALVAGADIPDVPTEPDLSCFERVVAPEESENVYEAALKAGLAIKDSTGAPVVWPDAEGHGTWVRARELYGLIDTKRIDIQLPGRSRAMLAYFRERYTVHHHEGVTPPGTTTRVYAALVHDLHLISPPQEGAIA